jgi:hypothetical protein
MTYTDSFFSKRTQEFQGKTPKEEINRTSNEAFCLTCRGSVKLLSFSESLEFFRCDENELRSLVLSHHVHPIHNIGGVLMFCKTSIEQAFRETMPTKSFAPGIFITNPAREIFDIQQTQPN